MDWVTNQGLAYDDIIVVTAYMADKITSILSNVMRNVKFVVADQLLGTAGQLWYVRNLVDQDDDVIVVNGDVLTDISLSKALDFHKSNNAEVTIVSIRYRLTARYGVLDIGPNGEFKGWLEKPVITLPIVTGIYILKGFIIKALKREKLDMNRYIEGLQSVGRKIMVYVADGKYVDLGVPQDYLSALI